MAVKLPSLPGQLPHPQIHFSGWILRTALMSPYCLHVAVLPRIPQVHVLGRCCCRAALGPDRDGGAGHRHCTALIPPYCLTRPRFMFWVDVIAVLPWDLIVMAGLGITAVDDLGPPGTSLTPSYIAVLKWVALLRMYRLVELFTK